MQHKIKKYLKCESKTNKRSKTKIEKNNKNNTE